MSHAFTDLQMVPVDKSSNFTADKSPTCYVVTATGGSVTATLPAVSASLKGLTLAFHLEATTYPNTLTIDGNSSETIDGATTLVLYVNQDAVTIICDGDEWHTLVDKRTPHAAKIVRAAAQTINNNTTTKVAFDTEVYDVGGIADVVTNDRIDILRTGKYQIIISWGTTVSIDDGEIAQIYLAKNGTDIAFDSKTSPAADQLLFLFLVFADSLTAGDYLEMKVYHNEGASMNTNTTLNYPPSMTVMEIK